MTNNQQNAPDRSPPLTFLRWRLLLIPFALFFSFHCGTPGSRQELVILEGNSATDANQGELLLDQTTQDNTTADPTPQPDNALPQPDQRKAPDPTPDLARDRAPDTTPELNALDQLPPDENQTDDTPDAMTSDTPFPTDRGAPPDDVGTPCRVNGIAGTCKRTQDCTGNNQSTPGHCPGPKDIQCCTPKPPPTAGCDPNARPQPNAGLKEAPGQGGCRPGMVRVSNFCIDQYEASLVEILPNGQTQPWSPYFNPGQTKVRAVSIKGAVPQGYINGLQAAKACKEAGKRLCTDTEWLRACQSTKKYTYPYGNTRQPGVCNDARSKHPAVEYFKSSAQWVFSKIQHQCLNQLPRSLATSGSYTGCKTAENVFDMMGNLHEWTAATSGIFRGGFYVDTYRNGNGCYYRTTAHNTQHWDYSTGFRCCSN